MRSTARSRVEWVHEEHSHQGEPASVADDRAVTHEERIRAQLRQWIVQHSKKFVSGGQELDDRTALLEQGLLSSLDIVEFVLFIEELRGTEIVTDDIEPEVFASVDTIFETFFASEDTRRK